MAHTILLVEDEASIADTVIYALESDGFAVCWRTLARDGLAELEQGAMDLVILDVGLPDENGFELCKRIRQVSDIPIIFLTARKEEVDRIVGLEIGGDDYVTKPFSPREITARAKAILRRINSGSSSPGSTSDDSPTTMGEFEVNDARKQIRFRGHWLELTRYEYRILSALLRRPGHILSRTQLLEHASDEPEASFDRVVDSHIKSLRAKLRQVDPDASPIRTHRGFGYSLSEA